MTQERFKLTDVNVQRLEKLSAADAYYLSMTFQLGCAIGELIGMGLDPADLLEKVTELIAVAVVTRTQEAADG